MFEGICVFLRLCHLGFIHQLSKKSHRLASTSTSVFMILFIFFFKTPNWNILVLRLLNSRTRMTLKSSIVILQALETTAASLTSVASATSLASTASTALFSQKTSWSQWFDHQNDQYWSFFLEWFFKNLNFHRCMAPFLSEVVEASLFYWKLVDETQMSCPQKYTVTFKQYLNCIFLSVSVNLKETFQFETPCTKLKISF